MKKELIKAIQRLLDAYLSDGNLTPELPVIMSIETNGGAIRKAQEVIKKYTKSK
jgi:hypothetical protein